MSLSAERLQRIVSQQHQQLVTGAQQIARQQKRIDELEEVLREIGRYAFGRAEAKRR